MLKEKNSIDFHKLTVDESIRLAEKIINIVRSKESTSLYEFITGQGKVQEALLKLLKDYGLDPKLKIGNNGVITVEIE